MALSRQLGVPLVTADEKLKRKLEGAGYDIRLLGELTLGPA